MSYPFRLSVSISLVVLSVSVYAGERKSAPQSGVTLPTAIPSLVTPEVQSEGHTCGFHALSSVYRAYGLDSEQFLLRRRLGTDVTAVPLMADSKGTLHPDLFRVLNQDGFEHEELNLNAARAGVRLVRHLEGPHPALVLIELTQTGGLHWVVFQGYRDGRTSVADSLKSGLRSEILTDYLHSEKARTVLLLKPQSRRWTADTKQAHRSGLLAMARLLPLGLLLGVTLGLVLMVCVWIKIKR